MKEKARFSEETLKSILKEMSLVGRTVSWCFKRKQNVVAGSVKKFCGGEERDIKAYMPENFDIVEEGIAKYCKSRKLSPPSP